jgi:hypothetical protein
MPSTLSKIKAHVAAILKTDTTPGSEDDVQLTEAVDYVGRRLWQMRPWPERVKQTTIITSAPYSTGTADFTLNSTTVTGHSTTWSGYAGYKIARGYSLPWYRVSTNGGVTSIVLDRVFREASASLSNYVVYQDEIDVATDVDTITACNLVVNGAEGQPIAVGRSLMDDYSIVQTGVGKPRGASLVVSTTDGTKRVRVTPVPDAAYAILVTYDKSWSKLAGDNDVPSFHENREWLLVEGAILYGQRLSSAERQTSEGQLEALADKAWKASQPHAPILFQREPWGAAQGVTAYITGGDE